MEASTVALRLGVDFGTATTCVATVSNLAEFRPEVIPIAGDRPFVDSLVWVSQPNGKPPIVQSGNALGRSPIAVFDPARTSFWEYWGERVKAQADGVKWYYWRSEAREQSMLLSYFKPELADNPAPRSELFPATVRSTFDP